MTPGGEPDAERLLFAKQIQQRLEKALAKLSDRQRAVFSLRHYDALPLDDIADILKLDIGTVKAHLFRAVSKMRDDLRDLYTTQSSEADFGGIPSGEHSVRSGSARRKSSALSLPCQGTGLTTS